MQSRYGIVVSDEKGKERFNCDMTPFSFLRKVTIEGYSWQKDFNNEYFWDIDIPWGEPVIVFKHCKKEGRGETCNAFLRKNGTSTALHVQCHAYQNLLKDDPARYQYEISLIGDYFSPNGGDYEFYIFVAGAQYLPKEKFGIEFFNSRGEKIYSSGYKTLECEEIRINVGYVQNRGPALLQSDYPNQIPSKPATGCFIVGDSFWDYTEDYMGSSLVWDNSKTDNGGQLIQPRDLLYSAGQRDNKFGHYISTNVLYILDCLKYD